MKKSLLLFVVSLFALHASAQWSADGATNNLIDSVGTTDYGTSVVTTPDGLSYVLKIIPDGKDDNDRSMLAYSVQIVDKQGNKVLPDGGKTISREPNRSYTVINQSLMADKDGNAIIVTHDCRNAQPTSHDKGYTAYKINHQGELLWSKGTDLWDGEVSEGNAAMSFTQTDDGGYLFAWQEYSDEIPSAIRIEKLSADGKSQWKQELRDTKVAYQYPYVKSVGDNQVILVFLQGTNRTVMARMLDFDGSQVWEADTKLYQGGFDSTPVHTHFKVWQAPKGGVFVTWRDDRNYEGSYANYISYVKNDGTLGFPGGVNALKISHDDDFSRMGPMLVYDDTADCVYLTYLQFAQARQNYKGIYMQKISMDGELLWGSTGKPVVAMQEERALGYATVQQAGDGNIAVFYMDNAAGGKEAFSFCQKYDTDGNALWEQPLNFATTISEKSNLLSSALIDGKYWICNFEDARYSEHVDEQLLFMQRINTDGTLGDGATAIHSVDTPAVQGECNIYTLGGVQLGTTTQDCLHLEKGIYLLKDNNTNTTRKVAIQ